MGFERKSAVSAKNTWFWGNSPASLNKRRSRNLNKKSQSSSRLDSEAIAVKSSSPRNAWLNFLGSRRNKTAIRTSSLDAGKQQTTDINRQSNTAAYRMSHTPAMPEWLLRMYMVNRYSSILAFLLVVATLIVYGWTVYSQEIWSDSYRKLQSLQRHERQLNTANATLTSKMAQEAEQPGTELVSPTSKGTIFLPPTSNNYPRSSFSTSQPEPQPEPPSPLGY
ncbi:MAG: hypothetical protein HEQ13_16485 [Dolichospermum sp. DEX189]|jgi:(p)ppGpp synthase/HD superfamily hydrolase|uniref:Cell division protein FtsL n=1 Tax=Aphanizomenon flos-aquae FACHB-1040 TaxID=2692887 RepID=A0ABR8BWB6_APHFL|nr:hypothetical protein [Aphanizomenon flos-aquae]MBD2279234.1 hypothetical protein [Aphanizomenon flos-aquae FACHB-1040]MBO1070860.1 hypothetical protein [Dolichospermum sp. DEX189]